jgi:hypothetical protein
MADELTTAEIAQNFTAMGHSVALINEVIGGTSIAESWNTSEERQDTVDRNVEHLELMLLKDYWTTESMTAINSAITAGNGYTA